jgi:hypothetical protein
VVAQAGQQLLQELRAGEAAVQHLQLGVMRRVVRSWQQAVRATRQAQQAAARHTATWDKIQGWLAAATPLPSQCSSSSMCEHFADFTDFCADSELLLPPSASTVVVHPAHKEASEPCMPASTTTGTLFPPALEACPTAISLPTGAHAASDHRVDRLRRFVESRAGLDIGMHDC